ncbi:MAG: hypothetical protein NC300_02575 [Bacteroidales bacterium]|nr:hypothetical protein [Clostridium sp.]MCM1203003.1 hypothetical protein [Bacteroidales bacterium]
MQSEQYGFDKIQVNEGLLENGQCYQYRKESLVVAEATDKLLEWLPGNLEDLVWEDATKEVCQKLLKQTDCHFLLIMWREKEEEQLLFFSDRKRVRALEFLDYLIFEFGLVRGNGECATGRISSAVLSVKMAGMDLKDTTDYFLKKAASYFEDCDWIEAGEYARIHGQEIMGLPVYTKRRIAWAVVKSTDVVENGRQFRMKSLENESGLIITASENSYIMIGCRGEIYDISRKKFENTYEETEETLDVFEQMLDFLPAIETVPDGEYISLDEVAHLCYPKPGAGIYGRELEKWTKIFPVNGSEEYFLGKPGDYMAVRIDDFSDSYIIQRDIFEQTYEKKE